ncbi:MAG: L-glutamate gamma-semialdehyde dehydrogenase [Geobacteraceae bacterium GWC2_53_11]|nr:MAG: L-glutamate gamma-semialdehyde dehydrogenase [Geobacteraceae bacterium GWC2_53_11]
MQPADLNERIIARGRALYSAIAGEKPALFASSTWTGKVMAWSMRHDQFKLQLFRFVDVFPTLTSSEQLTSHIRAYFGEEDDMPPVLSSGARMAGMFGTLGGAMLAKLIAANIHEMARQFIIGEHIGEAVKRLGTLRSDGYGAVVDVLGEATLSADEAEKYIGTYLELLTALEYEQQSWSSLPGQGNSDGMDWGDSPKINVAVKPTALFSQANPQDFEGSVQAILDGMRRICNKVVAVQGFLCIDMESYRFKDITLEVYRRLRLEYRSYPHIGIVLQAYLHDTERDLADLLEWAVAENVPISVRLVKGAYWDFETVKAAQMGWQVPVRTVKGDTDAAFERLARMILTRHDICHFACASHNIRTVAAVIEIAKELKVPTSRYEFQMLYGMAEPVRRVILKETGRVRLYSPYGDMVAGMGYLVRRLLENTSNDSFLRQSFSEEAQVERLLEDPAETMEREQQGQSRMPGRSGSESGVLPLFINEPLADFTRPEQRAAFPAAIARYRSHGSRTCPLFINGTDVVTAELLPGRNPAAPSEILGQVCQAGIDEVASALSAATAVFPVWRDTPPRERAGYLLKAAEAARGRIFDLAALQVLEVGKQWDQAYADVGEAIDFLEYYAREMVRLGEPRRLGCVPGELNHYSYDAKGVAVVIAPWNFPLAISTGMVAAAIVAGNPVVFKPSSLAAIVGHQLVELFRDAGLPAGVFNYVPGRSEVIGDFLVEHPDVSLIAFTGSMAVGLHIIERAAVARPGQTHVKKVVCEMGGKNAIIIDDDADLDEAIPAVLTSAFGFQGQKCSACSRVIVSAALHDRFVERLVKAARGWRVGPAEDPACAMGAVVDGAARTKIREFVVIGREEGRLLYESPVPPGEGYWVPLTIIGDIRPDHRLAQEEIFGPVLAVMRAKDFDQALEWANATRFALTGGVFSRSPEHLERAWQQFRVGNLYINRGITGALVGRQPFGGARMSGTGTKAGGPDYLLHFMDPRVVTENTMRRGFAPEAAES